MSNNINELKTEIEKIIEIYLPYGQVISIPIDEYLFHFLTIPGIYILYSNKKIIYIGSSINVGARLKKHTYNFPLNEKAEITDIKVIRLSKKDDIINVEAWLIDSFKPCYNKRNEYFFYEFLPNNINSQALLDEIELGIK